MTGLEARLDALEREIMDLRLRDQAGGALAFDMLAVLREIAPLQMAARLADILEEVEHLRREGHPRLLAACMRASWFQNGAFPGDDAPAEDADPKALN